MHNVRTGRGGRMAAERRAGVMAKGAWGVRGRHHTATCQRIRQLLGSFDEGEQGV